MPTNAPAGKAQPPLSARQKALIAQQHARNARRVMKPLAPQAKPIVAMGVLVLASAALNAAKAASDADAAIMAGTAATCVVIAVVAAKKMNTRLDDKKLLLRAKAFVAVCAGWLTTTTVIGLSVGATTVLAALGCALSLHWWRAKRIPNVQPRTAAPAAAAPYAKRWADNIGGQGGVLPGTTLSRWASIPAGDRYTLALVPGKQNINTVMGVLENLRTGLGLHPEHDMIFEAHPDLDSSYLQFTIVTRSPVRESQVWPGPNAFNPATGRISLGPFTDGEGVATWKAYTDNRLWGGYLCGGTGSGKSRMIESIAFSLGASTTHPTVVWYGDGQGGSSSPLLVKTVDNAAITHEAIHGMLFGAYLVMRLRQDENLIDDLEGFTPLPDRPGVLVIVDEMQKCLSKIENPELAEHTQYLFATIAREGGKVGVALIGASQESTLGAFGGAGNLAEMIRSNLLMGNGIILRSKDANAKQVFGVDVTPRAFPELAGYAFCVDREPGGRSAPFRGWYVTDEQRKEWPPRIDWKSLDVGAANAYGPEYGKRHETMTVAKDAARARVKARREGRPVLGDVSERSTMAAFVNAPVSAPVFDIAQFPTWQAPIPDQESGKPRTELHKGHHAVLKQVRGGNDRPKSIADATGYSVRQVHNLLDELMDDFGLVGRDGHGEYTATEVAAQ